MYELKLEGMTCEHCIRTVENAIRSVDEHSRPKIDLETQLVQLETEKNIQVLSQAIENEGYPVVSVKEI